MLLLATLFFPLAAALLVYMAGNKNAARIAFAAGLAELGLSIGLLMKNLQGLTPSFSHEWITDPHIVFAISADGLSILLVLLTTVLTPLILLSSMQKEVKNARVFYSLILLMQFALIGVFVAMDGFLYYIFWELALIPIYFIALLWGDGEREVRNKVVFKFFVYTLAGSLFMLLGFIWLYQHTGSFLISDLYALNLSDKEQCWIFAAFFLAYAIKIPIIPFHTWQPDTYRTAPTAGTMLLSGIMLKMGIYSLLRWLLPVVPHGVAWHTPYVMVLCIIGVIYGSIIAIRQGDLKRLIAYSSIAHVGLIAAGVFALTNEGLQGSVVQMLAHGVNVVGAFFIGEIILRRTGTLDISKLGGIRNVAPKFAACALIVVLASVALPLTNGFIGEFLLLYGVYQYNTILSIFAGLTIILGAVYMLRMYQNVFLGNTKPATETFADLTMSETSVFAVIIAIIFVFGIYPKPILHIVQPVIENLLSAALR